MYKNYLYFVLIGDNESYIYRMPTSYIDGVNPEMIVKREDAYSFSDFYINNGVLYYLNGDHISSKTIESCLYSIDLNSGDLSPSKVLSVGNTNDDYEIDLIGIDDSFAYCLCINQSDSEYKIEKYTRYNIKNGSKKEVETEFYYIRTLDNIFVNDGKIVAVNNIWSIPEYTDEIFEANFETGNVDVLIDDVNNYISTMNGDDIYGYSGGGSFVSTVEELKKGMGVTYTDDRISQPYIFGDGCHDVFYFTDDGIYKTDDAGVNWNKIDDVNQNS